MQTQHRWEMLCTSTFKGGLMDQTIQRAEHEEFRRRMEDEHERIHQRIAKVEQTVNQVHSLASSVERLAVSVEQMARIQKEHADQLEELQGRDGERWRQAVGYAVTAVIGIVIGFVFNKIGM